MPRRDHAVTVTWDPRQAEPYAIRIDGPAPWPDGARLLDRLCGPRPLGISTARHRLTEGGRAVTVTDTGFGNVLDGLEFNATATAVMGGARVPFSLDGAAEPVRAFRACTEAPLAGVRRRGARLVEDRPRDEQDQERAHHRHGEDRDQPARRQHAEPSAARRNGSGHRAHDAERR
jgi:hypothetical protein